MPREFDAERSFTTIEAQLKILNTRVDAIEQLHRKDVSDLLVQIRDVNEKLSEILSRKTDPTLATA